MAMSKRCGVQGRQVHGEVSVAYKLIILAWGRGGGLLTIGGYWA